MLLFVLALIAAEPIDELPLIAPIVDTTPRPAENRLDRSIHIGAKATGLVASGPLLGASGGGIEIGYRLPFLGQRLGLIFDPSILAAFERNARGSNGWLISLPIGLSYHEPVGPGLLRVTALASFDLGGVLSPTSFDRFFTIGMQGGIGYVIPAGLGGVTIELRYRMLSYLFSGANVTAHGGTASIGYSFFL